MRSGVLLVTSADGRRRQVPVESADVRIGSAPDNDLVLDGPVVAPYHATIRVDAAGDFLVRLTLHAGGATGASLAIELPRAFAPALLARIGGWVLSYKPESQRATRPIGSTTPAEAPRARAVGAAPDLLNTLLQQEQASQPAADGCDPDAVTMEMPALRIATPDE